MPYVATRTLRESLPTGEVVTHEMGAVLTRFETWNYAVRAALLRRQDVVEAAEGAEAAQEPAPALAAPVAPREPVVSATPVAMLEPLAAAADELACPHCPGKAFANLQGLRLHTTRMHKGNRG